MRAIGSESGRLIPIGDRFSHKSIKAILRLFAWPVKGGRNESIYM
jgi:hypothetical protein